LRRCRGSDAVLERARSSFEDGDFRWVAQVVNHVVFADPDNAAARDLLDAPNPNFAIVTP